MKTTKGKILWVDDEIDHLRSHIVFLEEKGYAIHPVSNAKDALSILQENKYDLVLLDEMMPGMDGLQALAVIKEQDPAMPVVMITKSEEENLMEEAIGAKIEDYLTKPVNPSQILSSCKRILERQKIAQEKITRDYTAEFGEISAALDSAMSESDWIDIHIKLSERDLDLDAHPDLGLRQTLDDQRKECNQAFGRFVEDNYVNWIQTREHPVLSTDVVKTYVAPPLQAGRQVLFIVIDNLRLDQWMTIEPLLYEYFNITRHYYFSILPTATPFSRNSIFSGLFPVDIEKKYPDLWKMGEDDESSRNRYEDVLLIDQLKRLKFDWADQAKYIKLVDPEEAKGLVGRFGQITDVPLTAMVFNFVDILAHRRSDSQVLREIVPDEPAYRSLTKTWFEHSALFQVLKLASKEKISVVLTTDHGSIRAMRGATVFADKETSTNLRYKYGRAIRSDKKQIMTIKDPAVYGLPARGINTNYLIAREDYYFVYPTNYHKYLALYRDSFQHGGISMEEMILPVVQLDNV